MESLFLIKSCSQRKRIPKIISIAKNGNSMISHFSFHNFVFMKPLQIFPKRLFSEIPETVHSTIEQKPFSKSSEEKNQVIEKEVLTQTKEAVLHYRKRFSYLGESSPWNWLINRFFFTNKSIKAKIAKQVYQSLVYQAETPILFERLGLEPTFQRWFAMTVLHLWIVLVRLRLNQEQKFGQSIFNWFWQDTEERLLATGFTNQLSLNIALKKYSKIYFGSVVAYDEGLMKGDAVLADALYRNLFAFSAKNNQSQRIK